MSLPDLAVKTWEAHICPSAVETQNVKMCYVCLNLADVNADVRNHDPLRGLLPFSLAPRRTIPLAMVMVLMLFRSTAAQSGAPIKIG